MFYKASNVRYNICIDIGEEMDKKTKILNIIKKSLLLLLIVPCIMIFSACSMQGKSAYDLAVENGFQGTVKDWLASLQGKNGEDGKDGENSQIDTYELYESAIASGEFEGSYLDFIREHFLNNTTNLDTTALVANENALSVCEVYAFRSQPTSLSQSSSGGSGVVYSIDNDGNAYIITNYHVTYYSTIMGKDSNYPYYRLLFYGSTETVSATFVGGSKKYDISVLKVTRSSLMKKMGCKAVTFRDDPAHLAESVIAIGNARGYGVAVTTGVVSVHSDNVKMTVGGVTQVHRLIRFDAFIEHGSSGGALFDSNGKLLGITNGGDEGYLINYAIPATITKPLVEKIIETCNGADVIHVTKPVLGIETETISSVPYYDSSKGYVDVVEEIKILLVKEDSLAEVSGLKAGDILESVIINGKEYLVTKNYLFSELLLSATEGDEVKLYVSRNGQTQPVEIVLNLSSIYFASVDAN